jgi:ferritin-like metal-binding protein YciE
MKLNTLQDLYVQQLHDLLDCENQLVKALDKMGEKASYSQLQSAFAEHREQTKVQSQRLEQIFDSLGEKPKAAKCEGIRGIIDEGEDLAKAGGDSAAIDAGLIGSAQKAEHYEIASYGTIATYAEMLGRTQDVQLLRQTLEEEKETDRKLTSLAERLINVDAVRAAGQQRRVE